MPTQTENLWVIADGKPGHMSQSRGLVAAVELHRNVQVHWLNLSLRSALLRSLLRALAFMLPKRWLYRLLPLAYRYETWPSSPPALIMSAGGDTLFVLGALAAHFEVPSIFSGTTKRYPTDFIDRVFTVTPDPAEGNQVLALPPADVQVSNTFVSRPSGHVPIGCVLVGGNGAGCVYKAHDWARLSRWMQLHHAESVRWQLTTSRRTGVLAEQELQAALSTDNVFLSRAIWWYEKPERVMSELLADCDFVVCTMDSLSMLAEAIYTGKPVYVFAPEQSNLVASDAAAIEHYRRQGFLQPVADSEPVVIAPGGKPRLHEIQVQIYRGIEPLMAEP